MQDRRQIHQPIDQFRAGRTFSNQFARHLKWDFRLIYGTTIRDRASRRRAVACAPHSLTFLSFRQLELSAIRSVRSAQPILSIAGLGD